MKYKFLLLLCCFIGLSACKSAKKTNAIADPEKKDEVKKASEPIYYTEQVRNDFRAVSETTQKKFLEMYGATANNYAILFFTQGFTGEEMVVKNNNDVLYKGTVFTNKQTGLAKNMRIVSTEMTSIYDTATKKTIYIKPNKASKHKFIYVLKGNINEEKPYKITFSDKLRPEK